VLVAGAAALARQQGLYVQIGLIMFGKTDHNPFLENRVILLDPNGTMEPQETR
jgi:hypothetical protein